MVDRCNYIEDTDDTLGAVEAKAYLGRHDIYEFRVPYTVSHIGDWAFAGARNLERLWLPARNIEFGRCVFDKCVRLRNVFLYGKDGEAYTSSESASRVLADYLTKICGFTSAWCFRGGEWNEYLRGDECGGGMSAYDRELIRYISLPEDEGFEPMWFGGEEDYDDATTNVGKYMHEKRMERIGVVYDRLAGSVRPGGEVSERLYEYFRKLMPETFLYLCEREPENVDFFHCFLESGCVTKDILPYVHTFCHKLSTENNALLLEYERNMPNTSDVFDIFSL